MLSDVGGGRLASVMDVQSLSFFIKENWICATTRHHAEPNINILLTRNLPFDSDFRKWSHPSMIPLHCLWAKSNKRTLGQFESDVTWFCFCSFTCTVPLLSHSLFTFSSCANINQINQSNIFSLPKCTIYIRK